MLDAIHNALSRHILLRKLAKNYRKGVYTNNTSYSYYKDRTYVGIVLQNANGDKVAHVHTTFTIFDMGGTEFRIHYGPLYNPFAKIMKIKHHRERNAAIAKEKEALALLKKTAEKS